MALSKPAESNRRNQTGVSRRMRVSLADRRGWPLCAGECKDIG